MRSFATWCTEAASGKLHASPTIWTEIYWIASRVASSEEVRTSKLRPKGCASPSLLLPPSLIWGFIRTWNLHGSGHHQPNSSLHIGLHRGGISCFVSVFVPERRWVEAWASVPSHSCTGDSPERKTSWNGSSVGEVRAVNIMMLMMTMMVIEYPASRGTALYTSQRSSWVLLTIWYYHNFEINKLSLKRLGPLAKTMKLTKQHWDLRHRVCQFYGTKKFKGPWEIPSICSLYYLSTILR